MTARDPAPSPRPDRALPAEHAFVIRFRDGVDSRQERVDGWIEHVVSGRAVRFGSWADLRAFVHRLLPAPDDSRE